MNSFDSYVRRVFFGSLSLILLFAGIFLLTGHKPWARGVSLGGAASLVNLVIMARDVRRQGNLTGRRSLRSAYGPYALRMTIIAAILIYAATSKNIALWATVPALFTSQFAMTCGELLRGKEQEKT